MPTSQGAPASKNGKPNLPRPRRTAIIPATVTLASWRLRKAWPLLLITQLGMVAAVLLLCMVPLFSQVAISGGIRSQLLTDPSTKYVSLNAFGTDFSASSIHDMAERIDREMQQVLGKYLSGPPIVSATNTFPLGFHLTEAEAKKAQGINPNLPSVQLVGRDLNEVSGQVRLLSGRLPDSQSNTLEVALPSDVADELHVTTGSRFYLSVPNFGAPTDSSAAQTLTVDVVGVFTQEGDDVFLGQGSQQSGGESGKFTSGPIFSFGPQSDKNYPALASNSTLESILPAATQSSSGSKGGPPSLQVSWRYALNLDSITANDLDTLGGAENTLNNAFNNRFSGGPGSFDGVGISGALLAIQQYTGQITSVQVIVTILLIQVMGLVLLFVSAMASILVERQSEAIALLRSRGAYRRQIFGALATHGVGMSLVALIAGPLLAIPLVRYVSQFLLSAEGKRGLSVLDGSPLTVVWTVRWYALAAVIIATVTILNALFRSANRNVLALRRETARSTVKPLWQRLNLDLVLAALGGVGYAGYLFVLQQLGPGRAGPLSALAIVAPFFLLLACALVFLRIFPLALRFMAWLATRRSGATSVLALSQMARAPREFSRMLLQLALSTAYMLFTLIFITSQLQHVGEVVTFQTVSDFSGTVPATLTAPAAPGGASPTARDITTHYAAIAGVTSASAGLTTSLQSSFGPPVQVLAVDPADFAQTAIWSPRYGAQPLTDLAEKLVTGREQALSSHQVPAIVDDALWSALQLSDGATFSEQVPGVSNAQPLRFVVVGRVAHLPPVSDLATQNGFGGPVVGGLLVDYASYAAAYNDATGKDAPAVNTVWLRTADDPGSLASVRAALTGGALAVTNLADRRQQIEDIKHDPLQLDVLGTLAIGAALALVLALIGLWTASVLNAQGRLTSFAVLRAMGTTPGQILSMLVWEQGIVAVSALVVGALMGWLLSTSALPSLVFVSFINHLSSNNGFTIDVPPAQVILQPALLGAALGALALICLVAIFFTTFAVSRASLSESLRLNQD